MLELALRSWLLLSAAFPVVFLVVLAAPSVRAAGRRALSFLRENFTVNLSTGAHKPQLYPVRDTDRT